MDAVTKSTGGFMNNWEDLDPCEICMAHRTLDEGFYTFDVYIYNPHCRELRRNRIARENKNTKPTTTVF